MASEIEQSVISKLHRLPPDRQREVLDFVEFLEGKSKRPSVQPQSLCGIYAHLGVSISAEEIDEVRREAWSGFPREDI